MDAGAWFLISHPSNVIKKIDEGFNSISTTPAMLSAEDQNISAITLAINGGENGLAERKIHTRKAKKIFFDI